VGVPTLRIHVGRSTTAFSDCDLTDRERQLVQLIAEGKMNKQVENILNISIKTVEAHRSSVMQKLNLRTTAELVRYAVRNKLPTRREGPAPHRCRLI